MRISQNFIAPLVPVRHRLHEGPEHSLSLFKEAKRIMKNPNLFQEMGGCQFRNPVLETVYFDKTLKMRCSMRYLGSQIFVVQHGTPSDEVAVV